MKNKILIQLWSAFHKDFSYVHSLKDLLVLCLMLDRINFTSVSASREDQFCSNWRAFLWPHYHRQYCKQFIELGVYFFIEHRLHGSKQSIVIQIFVSKRKFKSNQRCLYRALKLAHWFMLNSILILKRYSMHKQAINKNMAEPEQMNKDWWHYLLLCNIW